MSDLPATPSRRDAEIGIAFMLLAMFLFTANDALGKWVVADMPVGQILAVRSAAALALLALIGRLKPRALVAQIKADPALSALRLALVAAEPACFYWSVRYLPLADVFAFYMASPLFLTILSAVVLREPVGPRRWTAVLLGLVGVVLVFPPSGAALSLPALVALAGSLSLAGMLVLTRMLRHSDAVGLLALQTLVVGLAGAATLPFAYVAASPLVFGQMAVLGVVALAAHYLMNQSVSIAPSSLVAPFQYSSIVWAILLGYLVWGDFPSWRALAGTALITGSGLAVLHFERRAAQRAARQS
ncbi:DMT family transporter [Oceanomicrobium pacificus]|uniref:EamA family transporter n=1 Tax=Oceanomicrobium pacificus TaxID=2692916 RepID=A0A6B0TJK6_9RHOB|nr:DMT family transporter [Oceanomicrobium pacificus]MXU64617.1 EamA family transporter [Oceanomicrobium pacificus]